MRDRRLFLVLCGMAGLLFFCRLHTPLQEPEESRYAEIPREMLAHQSWVVPLLNGRPYYDKPPLLYWLVMASYRTFGVHDWAARIVPGTAGLLTIAITFLWGRRILGSAGAFWGAVVLCLSIRFVYLERLLTMNGLLCLWVIAGLAAAWMALQPSRRSLWWWMVAGVASGLGILTKGPVALVLIAVPAALHQILQRQFRLVEIRGWLVFVLTAVLVACPWFVAASLREPDFLSYFLLRHNVERFLEPFDHAKPAWFYLIDVLGGMLPGTLVLPWVLYRTLKDGRDLGTRFLLVAGCWSLLFFSLAGSKRSGYILPVMPLLALAIGGHLARAIRELEQARPTWARRVRYAHAAIFCAVLAALYFGLPRHATTFAMRKELHRIARALDGMEAALLSYPRGWDSVSFYLGRDDGRIYHPQTAALLARDLTLLPKTFAVIKSGKPFQDFRRSLPRELTFVPVLESNQITAGWVRHRSNP
jgi:4-amino-4-deoxy-L-arabinose transferase-like glycosyltransferase